jgi:membrane fusion protein, multidrug efflux system
MGLSTLTRINTSQGGEPILSSSLEIKGNVYRTKIYENEKNGVENLFEQIIA